MQPLGQLSRTSMKLSTQVHHTKAFKKAMTSTQQEVGHFEFLAIYTFCILKTFKDNAGSHTSFH